MPVIPFKKGVHEIGQSVYAYLQPDGSWGWNNTGLVIDGEESLLVDTLFDERLTAEMLAALAASTGRAASDISVLVKTHACGVCHSDLHFIEGLYPTKMPIVLGHEAAGVVEKVGSLVTYVKPGDRVITCLSAFCGTCEFCRSAPASGWSAERKRRRGSARKTLRCTSSPTFRPSPRKC